MLLKRKFTLAKYSNGFCRFIFFVKEAEKGMILFATCIEMPLYLSFTRKKGNESKQETDTFPVKDTLLVYHCFFENCILR